MKKFMKKAVSWVLTASMVCPLLTYFPISYAAATDGRFYEGDITVNNNAAIRNFILDNPYYTTNGNITNVKYFEADMFNYNRVAYNTATLKEELTAIYNNNLGVADGQLKDSKGGGWDYQLDGAYFFYTAERWNTAYWDAYEDFGGVDLVTPTVAPKATGDYTYTLDGQTRTVKYVDIPSGWYTMYSPRAGVKVAADANGLVDGGKLDAGVKDNEKFYFEKIENTTYGRNDGLGNFLYYIYKVVNDETFFLAIDNAKAVWVSEKYVATGDAKGKYLLKEEEGKTYLESQGITGGDWSMRFNIFLAETEGSTDGNVKGSYTYVIKAGGEFNNTDARAVLNDYGASGFAGWVTNSDYFYNDENHFNSSGNFFNLYPVEYSDATNNTYGKVGTEYYLKNFSGEYALYSTYTADERRTNRLVSYLNGNFEFNAGEKISDPDGDTFAATEGYTALWKFTEVNEQGVATSGTGWYTIEVLIWSQKDGKWGFHRIGEDGEYLALYNGDKCKMARNVKEDDNVVAQSACQFRIILDIDGSNPVTSIRLKNRDGKYLTYTNGDYAANNGTGKDEFGNDFNANTSSSGVYNTKGLLYTNTTTRLDNKKQSFQLYDISALATATLGNSAPVDMRPFFCSTYDYTTSNPYLDWDFDGEGIVSGIAQDTLVKDAYGNYQLALNYPNAGLFDKVVSEEYTYGIYDNVGIPYLPIESKYEDNVYTTYVFDSNIFGSYFTTAQPAQDGQQLPIVTAQQKVNGNNGWLPFAINESNVGKYQNSNYYSFGSYTQVNFNMTKDGRIVEGDDESPAITFSFSGDDDVWVYIDGHLVLDIGGIHGVVSGTLNFAENEWSVSAAVDSSKSNATPVTSGKIFNEGNVKGEIDQTRSYFAADGTHTLTIYYVERGSVESNCAIYFNLPMDDAIKVTKNVVDENGNALSSEEEQVLADTDFTFTLKKVTDGEDNEVIADCPYDVFDKEGNKVQPPANSWHYYAGENINTFWVGADGKFTLKNGQTAVFTGLSLDEAVTYYVREEPPLVGIVQTDFQYTIKTDDRATTVYRLEEDGGVAVANTNTKAGLESVKNPEYKADSETSYLTGSRNSYGFYINGDPEHYDEIGFVVTNYWSLSDTIVIDYGLPVSIDLSKLPGWIGKDVTLSDLRIDQQYHKFDVVTKLEAESGVSVKNDVAFANDIASASGGSYVWQIGGDKDASKQTGGLTLTFNSDYDGKATLDFYYISGQNRSFDVVVNNVRLSPVECKSGGNWTTPVATPASCEITLVKGENTIEISGVDQSDGYEDPAPNLDYILITKSLGVEALYGNAEVTNQPSNDSGEKIQAESGILPNGNQAGANPADGTKVGGLNNTNTITFNVNNTKSAGIAALSLYYMQHNTARDFKVVVNGKEYLITDTENTGGWDIVSATPAIAYVYLEQGPNTITIGGNQDYAPDLDYFIVDFPETNITYQLTEQMTAVDVIRYTVKVTDTAGHEQTAPGLIYIVPATVMYYEENFVEEGSENLFSHWITYENDRNYYANWSSVGDEQKDPQEAGIVGDAAFIYGSDGAYLKDTADSNGTSMHVTTTTTAPAQFSYTFKGTGTTFYARTNDNSAYMKVVISDANGNAFYTYYRDTRYLDKNDAALDDGKTLYNIPVFSWDAVTDSGLGYGEYTITVTLAKEVKIEGNDVIVKDLTFYGTEFWLDGIRVFNPLDESPLTRAVAMAAEDEMMSRAVVNTDLAEAQRVEIAKNAYIADGEANPDTNTVREKLLADNKAANADNWKDDLPTRDSVIDTTFTDTNATIGNAMEYWLRGPKEEVYLAAGQSVTVYLKANGLDNAKVHLGVKIPFGGTGTITVNNQTITANGAADCYYDITTAAKADEKDDWYAVTITAGENAGLVSLTNLKVTMTNGYEILSVN